MGKVIASITTSVDGYVTGPDDGPKFGLGRGGERLHYWVMGGPWTYEGEHAFDMSDADKAFYEPLVANLGGGIVGRGMYDAAGAWGGHNPFPGTLDRADPPARGPARPGQRLPLRRGPRPRARTARVRTPATRTSRSVAAPTSSGRR